MKFVNITAFLRPKYFFIIFVIFANSCKEKSEKLFPEISQITESVYATGIIKSENQYVAYSLVNGIVDNVYVKEGDTIKKGQLLASLSNNVQVINRENALLASKLASTSENQWKLDEALQNINTAKAKMDLDSAMVARQTELWNKMVGTKVELELAQLSYKNSKSTYQTALLRYKDVKRQVSFAATQAINNLQISKSMESDFLIRSQINGIVYKLFKLKGELINPQSPIAVLGDASAFKLEMKIDENDIFKIKVGQKILITMDSYKGKVFEATVSRILPIMDEQSKTFTIEGQFVKGPESLYPYVTFEANVLIQTKNAALLIPRNYILKDSLVILASGDTIVVKTGLKDYQKIEILSGVSADNLLQKPK